MKRAFNSNPYQDETCNGCAMKDESCMIRKALESYDGGVLLNSDRWFCSDFTEDKNKNGALHDRGYLGVVFDLDRSIWADKGD